MTTYGMRTFKEDGSVAVEVSDWMLRVVHTQYLGAGTSGTLSLPEFDDSNATAYVMTHVAGKRPPWAVMGKGMVSWGSESWWPQGDLSAGTLFVVARR
ncbi:hypothetical protein [Pseudomonas entomophila]|uniref:hypothetical protein n=1 Tax=Pseudomonas entomophila TaxID=312306 RepID=UPI0020104CF1|nr:hypothetical protein [Pseudomonas entomophila]